MPTRSPSKRRQAKERSNQINGLDAVPFSACSKLWLHDLKPNTLYLSEEIVLFLLCLCSIYMGLILTLACCCLYNLCVKWEIVDNITKQGGAFWWCFIKTLYWDLYFLIEWLKDEEDNLYDVIPVHSIKAPESTDILDLMPGQPCHAYFNNVLYPVKVVAYGMFKHSEQDLRHYTTFILGTYVEMNVLKFHYVKWNILQKSHVNLKRRVSEQEVNLKYSA